MRREHSERELKTWEESIKPLVAWGGLAYVSLFREHALCGTLRDEAFVAHTEQGLASVDLDLLDQRAGASRVEMADVVSRMFCVCSVCVCVRS